jgi:hypothetical protein
MFNVIRVQTLDNARQILATAVSSKHIDNDLSCRKIRDGHTLTVALFQTDMIPTNWIRLFVNTVAMLEDKRH